MFWNRSYKSCKYFIIDFLNITLEQNISFETTKGRKMIYLYHSTALAKSLEIGRKYFLTVNNKFFYFLLIVHPLYLCTSILNDQRTKEGNKQTNKQTNKRLYCVFVIRVCPHVPTWLRSTCHLMKRMVHCLKERKKEKKRMSFIRFHGKIIIFMYAEQLKLKKQYFSSLQDMRLWKEKKKDKEKYFCVVRERERERESDCWPNMCLAFVCWHSFVWT